MALYTYKYIIIIIIQYIPLVWRIIIIICALDGAQALWSQDVSDLTSSLDQARAEYSAEQQLPEQEALEAQQKAEELKLGHGDGGFMSSNMLPMDNIVKILG